MIANKAINFLIIIKPVVVSSFYKGIAALGYERLNYLFYYLRKGI